MLSKRYRNLILISILVFATIFTRFIKVNWGDGFYFHPDENNMAVSVSRLNFKNFNPHFFAYGQFPLYLSFFSAQLVYFLTHFSFLPHIPFSNSILILRIWSAIFSSVAVIFFYLIGQKIFTKKYLPFIFSLLIIFNPGLIQSAHFGTTESILITAFAINIYLALNLYKNYNFKLLFISAFVSGIALASKVTAIFFVLPILVSLVFAFFNIKKKSILFSGFLFLLLTTIFFLLFSPYNLIVYRDFISTINYEASIASGSLKVFYTNQFLNTTPYIFQFTHIFPYVSGLPVFVIGIMGFFLFLKSFLVKHKLSKELVIIFIPSLIYFLYNGQLYIKWTRFMSPIFFIFPLFTVYFLNYINNKKIIHILTLLSLIPSLLFLKIYLLPDIRITASDWVKNNIPANSRVFSEAGNVVNFPVNNTLDIVNFDFYNLDGDPEFITNLSEELNKSEYVFIPSRRVFMNQNNKKFPLSQKYYQNLFNGNLGFVEIKKITPPKDFLLSSEDAEETWTVFDRPTIRIYKKFEKLSFNDYQNLLTL